MASQLKKLPALRLLRPFAAGILLQANWPQPAEILWSLASFFFTTLLAIHLLPHRHKFRWSQLAGMATAAGFICLAALFYQQQDIGRQPNWLGSKTDAAGWILKIDEPFTLREKSWKTTATLVARVDSTNAVDRASGRLLVYLRRIGSDSAKWSRIEAGQWILLAAHAIPIPPPANPGQFNYRAYCRLENITHQIFCSEKELQLLPNYSGKFSRWLHRIRSNVVRIIEKYIPNRRASGLAEALLIGYKKNLDPELLQAYASTGVVHIIAISGLHLGLVFAILQWLTALLKHRPKIKWLRPLLVLFGIWGFCLLAGAEPSVTRSAVMFSFLVISDLLQRRAQALNTLCFSAFLLLAWHPNWLWDIGFQLSFAAVASLILFMQPLYRMIYIRKKWLNAIWKMNAVTLAAQIFTLPLCLYHFHQFPNYFLIANLLCVPLASLLLTACIILVALAPITAVAGLWGQLVNQLLLWMNEIVQLFESLPAAVTKNIRMDAWQVLICYVFITATASLLLLGRRRALFPALMGLTGLLAYGYFLRQQDGQLFEFRFYQFQKQDIGDFVAAGRFAEWSTGPVDRNQSSYRFALANARTGWREKGIEQMPGFRTGAGWMVCGNRRIRFLNQLLQSGEMPFTDLLILQENARLPKGFLPDSGKIRQLLAGNSLPAYRTAAWRAAAQQAGIPFHDLKTDGFFALRCR